MLFLLFKLGFICSFGFTEDLEDLGSKELIELFKNAFQLTPYEVTHSDVTFYLVTQAHPDDPILITSQNMDLIDVNRKTIFVIHGYMESHRRPWYQNIASEYLKIYDINFIEVDWERLAGMLLYVNSVKSVEPVGNKIAQFIQDLNLSPEDIHIIGHSLGSHVAGFAGKNFTKRTGKRVKRISALDPAGPGFRRSDVGPEGRLDKDDATIVDVIHTDAGGFGLDTPIGTLDIYVNGGQGIQPGCLNTDESSLSLGYFLKKAFCSHTMSIKYFVEWINTGKFRCKFCKPVLGVNFLGDRCIFHHQDVVLRSEDVSEDVNGVCFTKTNSEKPYLS